MSKLTKMTKIGLFEKISKCYGPAAWVEIFNKYHYQLIVSELCNFRAICATLKFLWGCQSWQKWSKLSQYLAKIGLFDLKKLWAHCLSCNFSYTSTSILSFRICNFRAIGGYFKFLWVSYLAKKDWTGAKIWLKRNFLKKYKKYGWAS